jgi:hypothetical protein
MVSKYTEAEAKQKLDSLYPPDYPYRFIDLANSGVPRMRLRRKLSDPTAPSVEAIYPELYRKVIEAQEKGEQYQDAVFSYKIDPNEQYGDTLYQNKPRKSQGPGQSSSAQTKLNAEDITNLTSAIITLEATMRDLIKTIEGRIN